MADISKIQIESGIYDLKDELARNRLNNQSKPSNMNKVIFIGDSYSILNNQTTWTDIVIQRLGLSNSDYYKSGEHSTGFCNYNVTSNNRFINLLQNLSNNVIPDSDKANITHIIVCGGANDMKTEYTSSDIKSRIYDFITYANEHFINSKVYIGMIGVTVDPSLKYSLGRVLEAYSGCIEYGGIYLNGVENSIHDYLFFGTSPSDTVHPNQLGSTSLGNAIYTSLLKGSVNIYRNWKNVRDNVSYNGLYSYSNNNVYKLKLNDAKRITKQTDSLVLSPNNPIYLMDYTGGCVGGLDSSVAQNGKQYKLIVQHVDGACEEINGYIGTESYVHNNSDIRQRLVFYPLEIDNSDQGSGGYKVITNIYGYWITPTELEFSIYEC